MASVVTPDVASGATTAGRDGSRRGLRPEVAVILLWLALVGPLVQPLVAQSGPRLAMTGALVDDGTLVIDGYPLGVDFTTRDGHTYSDKAPGQSILAVPVYAGARLVGADPAVVHRPAENLTLWWVTLVTTGLPALVLVALMAAAIRRRGRETSFGVLAGMCFGTLLLPLSSSLYGHVLAACLAFGAWTVLDRAPVGWRAGALAGLLAGLAVATEYQLAVVVVVLVAWLALRRRGVALAGLLAGGLPVAVALAAYQWASTGSVLRSGYQTKTWEGESGFFSTHVTHPPDPRQLLDVLLGTRGLLLYTPIVALGIVGLVLLWRRTRDDAAAVGLAVLGAFLLLQASWANTWAGGAPGARYVVPALPFLAVGVAEVWGRTSTVTRAVVLTISIGSMGLATVTEHLMPDGVRLLTWHLSELRDDGPVPTLFTLALGPLGWAVQAALVATVVAALVRRGTGGGGDREEPVDAPRRPVPA